MKPCWRTSLPKLAGLMAWVMIWPLAHARVEDKPRDPESAMPWELVSDLDNDGEIGPRDWSLLQRSRSATATAEDRIFAAEYLFANDNQANGAADYEDSVMASLSPLPKAQSSEASMGERSDDDAEPIRLYPVGAGSPDALPTKGLLWFESEGMEPRFLRFYQAADCAVEVSFPFDLEKGQPSSLLYLRVEGAALRNSVPCRLSLLWGSKDRKEVYGRSSLPVVIVPSIGAENFRQAVRDYILEKNSTHYFKRVRLPSHTASVCFFLTEQTQVRGINARNLHGGAGAPSIFKVAEAPELAGCTAVINTSYGFEPGKDGYWARHQGSLVHEGRVDATCSVPNEQAKSGGEKGCVYSTQNGPITFAPRRLDRRKPQWIAGRVPFAESNAPWGKSYLPRPGGTLMMAADGVEPPAEAWEGSGGLVPERMRSVLLKEYLMIGELSDLCPRRGEEPPDCVNPALTEKKLVFVAACDRSSGMASPNREELWGMLRTGAVDHVMYDADPGTSVALAVADPSGHLRVRGIPGVTHEPEKSQGPVLFLKTYLGLVSKRVR